MSFAKARKVERTPGLFGGISVMPDRSPDAVIRCQDNLAFMRPLPAESMQLIVTSPPYNIGKSYEVRSPLADYVQSQAQVISECVRLLAPGGSLCWQVGNHVDKGEVFPLDIVLHPYPMRPCFIAAMMLEPTPMYGSKTESPAPVRESTRRSTNSTGNWQGCMVFST